VPGRGDHEDAVGAEVGDDVVRVAVRRQGPLPRELAQDRRRSGAPLGCRLVLGANVMILSKNSSIMEIRKIDPRGQFHESAIYI
jgi:hypothetical protein